MFSHSLPATTGGETAHWGKHDSVIKIHWSLCCLSLIHEYTIFVSDVQKYEVMTFDEGETCEKPGYVCVFASASCMSHFKTNGSTLSRPFNVCFTTSWQVSKKKKQTNKKPKQKQITLVAIWNKTNCFRLALWDSKIKSSQVNLVRVYCGCVAWVLYAKAAMRHTKTAQIVEPLLWDYPRTVSKRNFPFASKGSGPQWHKAWVLSSSNEAS